MAQEGPTALSRQLNTLAIRNIPTRPLNFLGGNTRRPVRCVVSRVSQHPGTPHILKLGACSDHSKNKAKKFASRDKSSHDRLRMEATHMRKFLLSRTAVVTLLALCAIKANAGTLTIENGPVFDPSSYFSNNSIAAQVPNGNLVQMFGNTDIAITPGSGAIIYVQGNVSVEPTDVFSFFYNLGIDLNSSVQVSVTIYAQAFNGAVSVGDSFVLMQGSHTYSDMGQSLPSQNSASGSYTFALNFTFANPSRPGRILAPDGEESLHISIPQDGLEFQVAPSAVPEPSTYALLFSGLGALLLVARRRRLA
jgi:hypothetical protein